MSVNPTSRKQQEGFTLVEVLVTMVIFVIGMLAVASLQMSAIGNNHGAYLRSQAMWLAYDMADRMRANSEGVEGGDYDGGSASAVAACGQTGGCNPSQMARNDLHEWQNLLANTLPNGEGVVCVDSTPEDGSGSGSPQCDGTGDYYAAKIWWYEKSGEETQRFTLSFRP